MKRETLAMLFVLAVGAFGVLRMQPGLEQRFHRAKAKEDVYALPAPDYLDVASLGHRAAAVDLIYAKLLLDYGVHWQEGKRPFVYLEDYVEAILHLEPSFFPIYRHAVALFCYRPPHGDEADARKARAVLERGLRERPYDYQVWQTYGEFLAFLGFAWVPKEEWDSWKRDGSLALARALELGSPDEQLLANVAGKLTHADERAAQVAHLRRMHSMIEDPDTRSEIAAQLRILEGAADASLESDENDTKFLDSARRKHYPFLKPIQYLLLGPFLDVGECAGGASAFDHDCALHWDSQLPSARKKSALSAP